MPSAGPPRKRNLVVRASVALDVDRAWGLLTSTAAAPTWLGTARAGAPGVGATRTTDDPAVVAGAAVELEGRPDRTGAVTAVAERSFDVTFGSGRRATVAFAAATPGPGAGGRASDGADPKPATVVTVRERGVPAADAAGVESAWRWALDAARFVASTAKRRADPLQAVVVVHGIGEQAPGSTIRGFASALLGDDAGTGGDTGEDEEEDDDDGRVPYYSKPDRFADTYELRRLQARRTANRPRTDFFELYWAHRIRDTKRAQVVTWLKALVTRRPSSVPEHLRPVYRVIRTFAALFVAGAGVGVVALGVEGARGIVDSVTGWTKIGAVSFGVSAVSAAVTGFLVNSLGDAVRYLSAHPENIAVRQAIREDGTGLLRRLHECGEYHRIVVVGHSLGSVIAYEMLGHYWAEVNDRVSGSGSVSQPALAAYEGLPDATEPADHQEAQGALWAEQRRLGHTWLVTDLVTVGSPLAHAGLLMATGPDDLAAKQRQRELPTCPPQWDERRGTYSYSCDYLAASGWESRRVLHHAALFGPTRWTNLYFKAHYGLFGDPVGGPLAPVFARLHDGTTSAGVRDVSVSSSRLRRFTPKAHSDYWRASPGTAPPADALTELRRATGLDARAWLEALADSLPLARMCPDPDRQRMR